MKKVNFNGTSYHIRVLNVELDGKPMTLSIGSESLEMALQKNDFEGEAEKVDEKIYFYVSDKELETASGKYLAEKCLDVPMTFISEE